MAGTQQPTPFEVACHGLRCLAADAGKFVVVDGQAQLCDGAMVRRLANEFLGMAEAAQRRQQEQANGPAR